MLSKENILFSLVWEMSEEYRGWFMCYISSPRTEKEFLRGRPLQVQLAMTESWVKTTEGGLCVIPVALGQKMCAWEDIRCAASYGRPRSHDSTPVTVTVWSPR